MQYANVYATWIISFSTNFSTQTYSIIYMGHKHQTGLKAMHIDE